MVLDAHGDVMSKSKGNVVSPEEMIAEYGADAVRAYGEFADKCEHPAAREAFLAIAREEGTHLTALEDRLMALIP